jgi:hypothetical protein
MKKLLLFILLICGVSLGKTQAQTFTGYDDYDTINFNGDTLYFELTGAQAGAWGNAELTIYYEGDFGDGTEYFDFLGEGSQTILGSTTYNPNGDCAPEDSITLSFPAADINTWAADGTIYLRLVPTMDVDVACADRAKIRLRYNYCSLGVPTQIATITNSDLNVCRTESTVTLTGTPAGGNFSGTGVSGSTLNLSSAPAGSSIVVTYTATDGIGCVTTGEATFFVGIEPSFNNLEACPDSAVILEENDGLIPIIWYSDSGLSNVLDTALSYTTDPLFNTTTFYGISACPSIYFRLDTITDANAAIVDHDGITGDDRGGIAVTPNYVYINGDNGAARYDLDLTNGIAVPQRDGLFSDLSSGTLYSFWNTSNNSDVPNPSNSSSDAIMILDDMLMPTGNMISLSQSLSLDNNLSQSGIFAGHGFLLFFNGTDEHFYVISFCDGSVTDLGQSTSMMFQGSENWADWGVAEFDGTNYYALYREFNDSDIHRLEVPNGAYTSMSSFSNLSDLASFTYNPWNNRWYFHYEGSGQFGGSSETLGYTDATDSTSILSASSIGCAAPLTVTIPNIELGADTTICQGNSITLFGGAGFISYTWNGNNNNFNTYEVTATQSVELEVISQNGCVIADSIMVTVNPLTVSLALTQDMFCNYNDPTLLSGGTPAGGSFSGNGVTNDYFVPSVAGNGTHTITYTFVDGNGCEGDATQTVTVDNCASVEENSAMSLQLSPNPTNGMVSLIFSNNLIGLTTIEVIDLTGKIIFTETVLTSKINLNLTHLPNGIYLIRAGNGNATQTERLILQH